MVAAMFVLTLLPTIALGNGPTPTLTGPAPGPLHIIGGSATGGCLAGAVRLPPEGPGFQTIHISRSAFWGAPDAIQHLEELGRKAQQAGLPNLLIEDISRPRGGPLPGGHVSHQIGLDADVGLDMRPRIELDPSRRETVDLTSLVRPDGRGVDTSVWTPGDVTLLRLAAALPDVDRILVNPAIKQQLCREVTDDREWLRLIRPWYGHAAHMHIHFRCPPGQTDCAQTAPPPAGDGCDATLQWWFDQLDVAPKQPPAPYHPPKPPAACQAILSGND
jgi:penicillin-insensitive murein DD-endopeptidase